MTRDEFDTCITEDHQRLKAVAITLAPAGAGWEDLLHTAVVKVCQAAAWEKCATPDHLRGYLYTTMRNAVRTEHAQRARRLEVLVDPMEWVDTTLAPVCRADPLRGIEVRAVLAGALATLPQRWQEIVTRRVVLDQSLKDTAASMDIPLGSVSRAYLRAVERLQEAVTV